MAKFKSLNWLEKMEQESKRKYDKKAKEDEAIRLANYYNSYLDVAFPDEPFVAFVATEDIEESESQIEYQEYYQKIYNMYKTYGGQESESQTEYQEYYQKIYNMYQTYGGHTLNTNSPAPESKLDTRVLL